MMGLLLPNAILESACRAGGTSVKAQADLHGLVAFARQAADDGMRIDQVKLQLMRRLLALGLPLLQLFNG